MILISNLLYRSLISEKKTEYAWFFIVFELTFLLCPLLHVHVCLICSSFVSGDSFHGWHSSFQCDDQPDASLFPSLHTVGCDICSGGSEIATPTTTPTTSIISCGPINLFFMMHVGIQNVWSCVSSPGLVYY